MLQPLCQLLNHHTTTGKLRVPWTRARRGAGGLRALSPRGGGPPARAAAGGRRAEEEEVEEEEEEINKCGLIIPMPGQDLVSCERQHDGRGHGCAATCSLL